MKYLRVKKWDEHQHYTDRDPPWIKVYNRLLDDYEFLAMDETSQAHLVKLWLLASRTENKIPNDIAFITAKIGAKTPVKIDVLIASGWLELSDGSDTPARPVRARKVATRKKKDREKKRDILLAEREQSASRDASVLPLETEERRDRGRGEKNKPLAGADAPVNWVAAAAEIFAPVGTFLPGRIGAALKPVVDRYGWAETERGLRDYIAAPNKNGGKKPEYFRDESGTWVIGAREPLVIDGVPTPRADRIAGVGR